MQVENGIGSAGCTVLCCLRPPATEAGCLQLRASGVDEFGAHALPTRRPVYEPLPAGFLDCGGRSVWENSGYGPVICGPGKERGPDGPGNMDEDGEEEGQTGIVTKTRPKTKRPSMYKVLILNDDYTPMEFVVHILERFFGKSRDEATEIMLHVHHKGVGICGVYTYEVAETKVTLVTDFSRKNQHPLQCTMEKE